MLLIDKYAYTNKLRNYPPQAKILIACGGIVISRLMDNLLIDSLVIILMIGLNVLLAKTPIKAYFKTLIIPIGFLLTSIIAIMVSINGDTYIFSLDLSLFQIGIQKESIFIGVKLLTTVLASLTSIYFLIFTTTIIDIIKVLKKIKLPNIFIELMVLVYRSIFIFLEEANNIYLAQSMKFGYKNNKNSIKSISLLIRNLLTRVFIKHKEMSISLECKLYNGEFKLGD